MTDLTVGASGHCLKPRQELAALPLLFKAFLTAVYGSMYARTWFNIYSSFLPEILCDSLYVI